MARGAADPRFTLAEELLLDLAAGRLHVSHVGRLAQARLGEGGADGTTEVLARRKGTHAERDLHKWAETQAWRGCMPLPYSFSVPMVQHGEAVAGVAHCLLPHELFATLGAAAPQVFEELFGTPQDREEFWTQLCQTTSELPEEGARAAEHRRWLREHPANHVPPGQRVPVGLHGDGSEMHGGEKVLVVSWGGLCRHGPTLDTRLLFCALKESEMQKEDRATLFRAFSVLAWSFKAMCEGRHPAMDEEGVPFGPGHHPQRAALAGKPLVAVLGGRLCGAFCELRGDWQFLRDALHLKHHYSAKQVCHLCAATGTEDEALCYMDFSDNAPARATLVGHLPGGPTGWASKTPVSPLCEIPGFSIWRCMFDLMHTLELGLLQRVVPAALQGLLGIAPGRADEPEEESVWLPGRNLKARCAAATADYLAWCRRNKISSSSRVKRITPRWLRGQWPTISQEHAKAAALRAMLPWVVTHTAARRRATRHHKLRHRALAGLLHMDSIYGNGKQRFLSMEQATTAQQAALAALRALAELRALAPGGPWHLVPKAHALQHIVMDCAGGNPRAVHCYQDEDFIGRVKAIYVSCHGRTAPMRAVQRYCLGTSLTIAAREEFLRGERQGQRAPPAGGPVQWQQLHDALREGARGARGQKRGRGRPAIQGPKLPRGRPGLRRG